MPYAFAAYHLLSFNHFHERIFSAKRVPFWEQRAYLNGNPPFLREGCACVSGKSPTAVSATFPFLFTLPVPVEVGVKWEWDMEAVDRDEGREDTMAKDHEASQPIPLDVTEDGLPP